MLRLHPYFYYSKYISNLKHLPILHLTLAKKEIGVREYLNKKKDNPRIIEYHKTNYCNDEKIAWCASFMKWIYKQSGYLYKKKDTGYSLCARSFSKKYNKKSSNIILQKPIFGCIVIFKYNNDEKWKGHIGIVIDITSSQIKVLGGNQSHTVKYSWYSLDKIEGFYWPKQCPISSFLN